MTKDPRYENHKTALASALDAALLAHVATCSPAELERRLRVIASMPGGLPISVLERRADVLRQKLAADPFFARGCEDEAESGFHDGPEDA